MTILLLFVPKFLALSLALVRERQPYGGSGRLLISAVLEMVFAVVVAPLIMMYHTRFVLSVLSGHDITWEPQVREGRPVAWSESWRKTTGTTVVGLTWATVTSYFSPTFFWWLTPIFAGLLCAAPLVRWTNSRALGQWTRRRGLFLVPSETVPSPELLGLELGRSGPTIRANPRGRGVIGRAGGAARRDTSAASGSPAGANQRRWRVPIRRSGSPRRSLVCCPRSVESRP